MVFSSAEMLVEEGEGLGPAVGGLLGTVGDAGGVEEGMPGAVVAVEGVILAELFQHGFGAVDLIGVGVLVVVAEHAQDRTLDVGSEIDRRDRTLGVERLWIVHDDVAAPAIHQRVEVRRAAAAQERMASPGAE